MKSTGYRAFWFLAGGILAWLLTPPTACADTNCDSDTPWEPEKHAYTEDDIDQNDCTNGAIALSFHPTVNNQSAKVTDWHILIKHFGNTDTCARVDDYEVDVDVSNGTINNGGFGEVNMRWYMNKTASCNNQLQLQDVIWTCNEGAAVATTVKAIPDHGWRIEYPEAWAGPEGDYRHVFSLFNREPTGGLSFYVKDLKFLPSDVLYAVDLDTTIDWSAIPTHPSFVAGTLDLGDSMQFQNIYTTGDPFGKYIYFRFEVWNASNTIREFVAYGRHPTDPQFVTIPAVSAKGLMGIVLLTIVGASVVFRRYHGARAAN